MAISTFEKQKSDPAIAQLTINTIRTLSIDAIQKAKSGHPGTPMALAPLVYTLWNRVMQFDPKDPIWPNRDRFILSNGHASMLLWSILHLTGTQAVDAEYENLGKPSVSLDDIRRFRQIDSRAPGHPEYHWVSGVETTTGPLGQGIATGVGMAIAEKWLANRYNKPGYDIFGYSIYAICGDGCLMEGVASEAASLAGHLGLDNLCWIYDNNHITIEGDTNITFTEDVATRFLAYGWHVLRVGDANDVDRIERAIRTFQQTQGRPTLIILDSQIGYGSPHKQDTPEAHGEPLGDEETKLTKRAYGWPEDAQFLVPEGVPEHLAAGIGARGAAARQKWLDLFAAYRTKYPALAAEIDQMQKRELPAGWDKNLPVFPADAKGIAGREASGKVLNVLAQNIPWFMGGSADLGPSNKTLLTYEGAGHFQAATPGGKNLHFGIREHAMAAVVNGLSLSKIRAFGATFFIFSDYARPAIRLSALMELPTIFVFTHEAMSDGEDGPTHQPVEHLASLRAIPGLVTLRPGDANEVVEAYRYHHAVAPRAGRAGAVATAAADPRPEEVRPGHRGLQGRVCAGGRPGGKPGSDPDRLGKRSVPGGGSARKARRQRHPVTSCFHAVLGYFRSPAAGIPGARASLEGESARRDRAGVDLRLGALRWRVGTHHRHEDLRGIGAAQGTSAEVRV